MVRLPSKNVTEPLGAPPLTVAVKVTGLAADVAVADAVTAVVVGGRFTVCITIGDELPLYVASPE
jgi:hypothetical protein